MFLIVQRHGRILHERIITVPSGAVEMPVDLVARTIRKATVHVAIVKLKAIQDVDVIMEVLAMHDQDVFFVGNIETPVLVAMIVDVPQVWAKIIRAFCVFVVHIETLKAVVLNLSNQKQVLKHVQ